jgi:hypothetical protein
MQSPARYGFFILPQKRNIVRLHTESVALAPHIQMLNYLSIAF